MYCFAKVCFDIKLFDKRDIDFFPREEELNEKILFLLRFFTKYSIYDFLLNISHEKIKSNMLKVSFF